MNAQITIVHVLDRRFDGLVAVLASEAASVEQLGFREQFEKTCDDFDHLAYDTCVRQCQHGGGGGVCVSMGVV